MRKPLDSLIQTDLGFVGLNCWINLHVAVSGGSPSIGPCVWCTPCVFPDVSMIFYVFSNENP